MRKSGIPISENNIKYVAALLKKESDFRHSPKKWVPNNEHPGEYYAAKFEKLGLLTYFISKEEKKLVESTKSNFSNCSTELDFYNSSRKLITELKQKSELFSESLAES